MYLKVTLKQLQLKKDYFKGGILWEGQKSDIELSEEIIIINFQ